eukprot:TRINITY_DN11052_c0_g1_i1.p1 TRINITY_DN11052_c0_g1~~TRINITY_DN11052_c0_g1_i1.p1  ORF type:complete len:771 (+),score=70.15 TRINITY_DN11052_c0_g1_i1:3029-5341(+)
MVYIIYQKRKRKIKMNTTTIEKSSSFLGGWVRYDIVLLLAFVLCVWFINSILVLLHKLKSLFYPTAPPPQPQARLTDVDPNPEEHLEKLVKDGLQPSIYTYNELLESYVCTKQFDKADNFFNKLREENAPIKPNVTTCNIYIRGLIEGAKAGKDVKEKLKGLLLDMKTINISPNVITLNNCIELSIVLKDTQAMWDYFEKMRAEYDIGYDSTTFVFILGCTKNGEIPDGFEGKLYEALYSYVQRPAVSFSEDFVILAIDACTKATMSEQKAIANKILTFFMQQKLPLPLCCYGRLFTHFAQNKNVEKIVELHARMQSEDIKLNDITYGCLLEAYFNCDRTDKILELYESQDGCTRPFNVVIYTTLIRAYAKSKKFEKVLELYEKARSGNDIKLNLIAYNALLDCCVQCEQYEIMEKILWNMIEEGKKRTAEEALVPDIITYSTIIKGLCKSAQLGKAFKLYQEMKDKGMKLDEVVFNSLLDGCVKHKGSIQTAMQLIEDMNKYQISCSNYTYSILIKLHTANKDIEKTLGVYEEMKTKGIVPGVIVYTCLLQACIKAKIIIKAIEIFGEMKKAGVSPDHVIYNTIINGCVYSGKLLQGCEALCEAIQKNIRLADDIYNNVLRNLLTYRNMSPAQKHQYASKICNYIALNKVNANQEYYYQVLNTLVFSTSAPVDPYYQGYNEGYYGNGTSGYYGTTPQQCQWGNYYYYYPNQQWIFLLSPIILQYYHYVSQRYPQMCEQCLGLGVVFFPIAIKTEYGLVVGGLSSSSSSV